MHRVFSMSLLAVLLFAQTELHQLVAIPTMVEHFAEHQREQRDISFATFLNMHYGSGQHSDTDDSRDSQLPFKSTECGSLSVVALHPELPLSVCDAHMHADASPTHPYHSVCPMRFSADIWQPPRKA